MDIDKSRIKKVVSESGEYLFTGYTDTTGYGYIIIRNNALPSDFEDRLFEVFQSICVIRDTKLKEGVLDEHEIKVLCDNISIVTNEDEYTVFDVNKFIRMIDTLDMFNVKNHIDNNFISGSGIILNYLLSTWLKYYSYNFDIDNDFIDFTYAISN